MPRLAARMSVGGEVAQRAQAGEEEVRSAAHSHELGKARNTTAQPACLRNREIAGDWIARHRLAITHQRIVLSAQARKLGVRGPRILQEFELPRDVRVEADEM